MQSIIELAAVFFIIANPIGLSPTIISLIKNLSIKEQQYLLLRESLFGFIFAFFFLFLGEVFLEFLLIKNYSLTISGGLILFIIAINMMFSLGAAQVSDKAQPAPFIVPIATPLLSGAGLLTIIMLSVQTYGYFTAFFALIIAWIGITAILFIAPYMKIIVGERGLSALEQLMGMILAMIGIQMIVQGIALFVNAL